MIRLARYLAQSGVASRRKADALIIAGEIRVNGTTIRELGTLVNPGLDHVQYGGQVVAPMAEHAYYVLHKPFGVITTMSDPEGRRSVADVMRVAGIVRRVVPVGRLDYDTAGVLLLTDDGDLAHVLTHPRFGVQKTYRATVRGQLTPQSVARLGAGLHLDDGRAAPARVHMVAARRGRSTVDITIHEGKNRQVRRMFEQLDHPVLDLTRMRFGPIALGALAPGSVRTATEREVRALRAIIGAAT